MNELLQKHGCNTVFFMPEGLKELMADISREVLRAQPVQILNFITDYLSALLITREHGILCLKICDELCDCRPTLVAHIMHLNIPKETAEQIADVIQKAINDFGKKYDANKQAEIEDAKLRAMYEKKQPAPEPPSFRKYELQLQEEQDMLSEVQRIKEYLMKEEHFVKEDFVRYGIETPSRAKALKVKEMEIIKAILEVCPLDDHTIVKLCIIARNTFREYIFRKKLLEKEMKVDPTTPWEVAANNTIEIYMKTKPSMSELYRATRRIQSAYRAYHIRRGMLHHLQPKKKKRTPKKALSGPPLDIAGEREIDFGPVLNISHKTDDINRMFQSVVKTELCLVYDPNKIIKMQEEKVEAHVEPHVPPPEYKFQVNQSKLNFSTLSIAEEPKSESKKNVASSKTKIKQTICSNKICVPDKPMVIRQSPHSYKSLYPTATASKALLQESAAVVGIKPSGIVATSSSKALLQHSAAALGIKPSGIVATASSKALLQESAAAVGTKASGPFATASSKALLQESAAAVGIKASELVVTASSKALLQESAAAVGTKASGPVATASSKALLRESAVVVGTKATEPGAIASSKVLLQESAAVVGTKALEPDTTASSQALPQDSAAAVGTKASSKVLLHEPAAATSDNEMSKQNITAKGSVTDKSSNATISTKASKQSGFSNSDKTVADTSLSSEADVAKQTKKKTQPSFSISPVVEYSDSTKVEKAHSVKVDEQESNQSTTVTVGFHTLVNKIKQPKMSAIDEVPEEYEKACAAALIEDIEAHAKLDEVPEDIDVDDSEVMSYPISLKDITANIDTEDEADGIDVDDEVDNESLI